MQRSRAPAAGQSYASSAAAAALDLLNDADDWEDDEWQDAGAGFVPVLQPSSPVQAAGGSGARGIPSYKVASASGGAQMRQQPKTVNSRAGYQAAAGVNYQAVSAETSREVPLRYSPAQSLPAANGSNSGTSYAGAGANWRREPRQAPRRSSAMEAFAKSREEAAAAAKIAAEAAEAAEAAAVAECQAPAAPAGPRRQAWGFPVDAAPSADSAFFGGQRPAAPPPPAPPATSSSGAPAVTSMEALLAEIDSAEVEDPEPLLAIKDQEALLAQIDAEEERDAERADVEASRQFFFGMASNGQEEDEACAGALGTDEAFGTWNSRGMVAKLLKTNNPGQLEELQRLQAQAKAAAAATDDVNSRLRPGPWRSLKNGPATQPLRTTRRGPGASCSPP
eukprot:TRINITY_DN18458_c0_g1_i1.p1 TRINITY_DN18458_c0_g1~~TRINITY_DN18458_c0_g1_i1.p1  ORF type:complete len:393 (+),score=123.92 TRINITY_DN18458_c0_g1_i1:80-1258(+)